MDLISDLFARLNNAQAVGNTHIHVIYNKVALKILHILQEENLISHWSFPKGDNPKDSKNFFINSYKFCLVHIKKKSFQIKRVSKKSARKYISKNTLWTVNNGLGFFILSTNRGIITCRTAKKLQLGGELICEINIKRLPTKLDLPRPCKCSRGANFNFYPNPS